MRLYITRHGETDYNKLHKVMGRVDEPLNEIGIKQAKILKTELKNVEIDLIICSPLERAKQTANIINEDRNIPLIIDERIIERDFGEFEALRKDEFEFKDYWNYEKNLKYQKAENIRDFFERIYEFLDDITKKYANKNVLLSAHAGISLPVACYFSGSIPNCSLVETDLVLDNCQVALYEKK